MSNTCISSPAFSTQSPVVSHSTKTELTCRWVGDEYLRSNIAAWEQLADSAIVKSVSFESNYLLPAIDYLAGPKVRVLAVELNSGGESLLVGLVPVEEKPIYRLPFKSLEIWKHDQCFDATPLLHKDYAVESWKAICKTVAASGYAIFSLDTVSAAAPFDSVLKVVEDSESQFRFQRDSFERAAFSPSESSEQYITEFVSKQLRKKSKRRMRGLEELGAVSYTHLTLPTKA